MEGKHTICWHSQNHFLIQCHVHSPGHRRGRVRCSTPSDISHPLPHPHISSPPHIHPEKGHNLHHHTDTPLYCILYYTGHLYRAYDSEDSWPRAHFHGPEAWGYSPHHHGHTVGSYRKPAHTASVKVRVGIKRLLTSHCPLSAN